MVNQRSGEGGFPGSGRAADAENGNCTGCVMLAAPTEQQRVAVATKCSMIRPRWAPLNGAAVRSASGNGDAGAVPGACDEHASTDQTAPSDVRPSSRLACK